MSYSSYTFGKGALLVAIMAYSHSYKTGALLCLLITLCYRYIIAKALGITVLPALDLITFYSGDKAPTNIISSLWLSKSRPEYAQEAFRRIVNQHSKMRSEIVHVLGDKYYSPLELEDVLQTQLVILPEGKIKNEDDI